MGKISDAPGTIGLTDHLRIGAQHGGVLSGSPRINQDQPEAKNSRERSCPKL
jgi:hypothetical protein